MARTARSAQQNPVAAPTRRSLPRQPRVKRGPGRPRLEDAARLAARSRILDAARRLFSTHGYECTTTRDIGDRAGVDAALVNYYFKTKEDLREVILQEVEEAGAVRLRPLVEDDSRPAVERLPAVIETVISIFADHPEFLPLMTELSIEGATTPWGEAMGLVNTCLEDVLAGTRGRTRSDAPIFTVMLLGMVAWPFVFRRSGRRYFDFDIADQATRTRFTAEVTRLMLAGIQSNGAGTAPARAGRTARRG